MKQISNFGISSASRRNVTVAVFVVQLITTIVVVGCAGIQVPDVPICRPLRTKSETKTFPDVGRVTLTRANPVCLKEVGEPSCLLCVHTVSAKETYVGDGPTHLIEVGGKKKSASLIMKEGAVLPAESWAEMRATFINACKANGAACSAPDITRWKAKIIRFDSVTQALQ